ncbi:DUF4214 domain-containing protein [Rugamonas sp. DEMB1]|uniref:DUF4214 domain-containing protein n=1 Tax=Rugamonas sp. DEMB1 TaxID=3039386 RepID=UPI00244A1A2A|nr:DUF4214 domain-containing protein [Rugamonas sp. DEMB1]WGG50730.1 DUF4214 domain-containing protein [Rugamonas sp. DEMB1]
MSKPTLPPRPAHPAGQGLAAAVADDFPAAVADDFPAGVASSGVLALGGRSRGVFETVGDVDWFKFHVEAGQHYSVGWSDQNGNVDVANMRLYDTQGRLIGPFGFPFEPASAGDYFLAVDGPVAGHYELVFKQRLDDYSINDSGPGRLLDGGRSSGVLESWFDEDRFKFTMEAGHSYRFQLSGDAYRWADEAKLVIRDAAGNALGGARSNWDGNAYETTFKAERDGVYSLDVSLDRDYPPGVSFNYTLSAPSSAADDHGNTMASATPLAVGGGAVAGSIELARDVDMFKLELQAGTTYQFDLQAADGGALTLTLSGADGAVIGSTPYDRAGHYSYTPASSGAYYLAAGSNGASDAAPSGYTLQAEPAPDDYAANPAGAGRLSIGGTLAATLGAGDRDWFAVWLNPGATYWFSLAGLKADAGWSGYGFTPTLRVLDAHGAQLAAMPGFNPGKPLLPFVAGAGGYYYVEVAAAAGVPGSYQMTARLGVADDVGNDAAHAAPLADGVLTAGRLELFNDKDVYKISAQAGHTYSLELSPLGAGPDWYPRLTLRGIDNSAQYGSLHTLYNGKGKPLSYFTAVNGGDYYFTVASDDEFGPAGGRYTLQSTAYGADDYAAGRYTEGVLPAAGRLAGRIGFQDDRDWVKVHLEAGRTYVFDLYGAVSGGGTLDTANYGTGMRLHYPGSYDVGPIIVSSSATGEPRISYIAASTGDYYLEAYGNGYQTGSYTLAVTPTAGDLAVPLLTGASNAGGAIGLRDKLVFTFNEGVMLGDAAGITLTDANGVLVPLRGAGSHGQAVGNLLLIEAREALRPGMDYTLTLPSGSLLDLAGNRHAGAESYHYSTAPTVAVGGDGDDYLLGSGKGLRLDGGNGIDTVYYNQTRSWFEVARGAGQATVKAWAGAAGDTLSGVERLLFQNQAWALDVEGNGGQAYRLYQAAFNRAPDQAGLGLWIWTLDKGGALRDVAHQFIVSEEFVNQYGSAPSDADFVNLLYRNVLHRAGESAGVQHWLDLLHGGEARESVLVSFSESAENQAALIGRIGNGFAYDLFH